MKNRVLRRLGQALFHYLIFFLVVGFVVTCCMTLFVTTLADTMGLVLNEDNIAQAAKLTFGNVLLLTLVFALVDYTRRKLTVERPVRVITRATERIMQGDFSVELAHFTGADSEGLNQIVDAVNLMARELGGMETLRTDFIANVSHELKTPLAVMGNYATLLQRPGLTEAERMEYAQAIAQASRRLARLITNILKLNKLENQKIFPKTEEYDLGEQLCQCLLRYEEAWEQKDLTIETDLEENVRIRSDAELLDPVWSNLISNAVKFTGQGGTVALTLKTQGDWVCVSVRDTGCGITPETGAHIFEKFYQGDTSHAVQGNGLGLALVKRVVDILGGIIDVQSVYGQGSTFTVRIRRD